MGRCLRCYALQSIELPPCCRQSGQSSFSQSCELSRRQFNHVTALWPQHQLSKIKGAAMSIPRLSVPDFVYLFSKAGDKIFLQSCETKSGLENWQIFLQSCTIQLQCMCMWGCSETIQPHNCTTTSLKFMRLLNQTEAIFNANTGIKCFQATHSYSLLSVLQLMKSWKSRAWKRKA